MQDLSEILSQLRDIHEPSPVGVWPPAPGWWLLLLALVLILYTAWYLSRRYKNSFRRAASLECERIVRDFEIHNDKDRLIKDVSIYLRRLALKKDAVLAAGHTGDLWLEYLAGLSESDTLISDFGKTILTAPYSRQPDYDCQSFIRVLRTWVRKLK